MESMAAEQVDSRQAIEAKAQAVLEQVSEEGVSESADFLSFKLADELYGVEIKMLRKFVSGSVQHRYREHHSM